MRRIVVVLIVVIAVVVVSFGGYFLWDRLTRVSSAELRSVVQRDGLPFQSGATPDSVLDDLAANRVIILGELYFLREHRGLVAELVRGLHARGSASICSSEPRQPIGC